MPASLVRVCLLVSVLGEAIAASAGVAYDVTRAHTAGIRPPTRNQVIADGGYIRADAIGLSPDEPVTHDSVLWMGSPPAIGLNSRNQTWYELTEANPFSLDSHYLAPLMKGDVKKLTVQLNAPAVVGGDRHYTGRISYDVHQSFQGVRLKVTCTATIDVTTTDTVDRRHWLGHILPSTGYADVDAKLRAAEASIEGFPVRLSMKATRRYEGGPPMDDTVEIHVTDIREVTPELTTVTRPANYRNQKPVLAVPGREGM
jgi:hypothetical protein